MKLIIDIPEDIRVAITRMGLLRIPDEMIRVVDKAIQRGTPLSDEPSPQNLKMWKKIFEEERRRANEGDN